MKFGNPISDVNATITGGTVNIAGPTLVANNSTAGTGTSTVTLLPAPPSGQRYYIGFFVISLSDSNGCNASIQETLTDTTQLWSGVTPSTANNPLNQQVSLGNFALPVGAGLSMTLNAGSYVNTFKCSVYYKVGA